jgi:hypothetical protein
MATGPPTITQLKERFISAQALHLSSNITPSAAFRAANQRSDEALDPRQLDTVATVLDGLILDHCRRIYAPQANRALAEQISDSYSREADRKLQRLDDDGDGIGKDVDLRTPALGLGLVGRYEGLTLRQWTRTPSMPFPRFGSLTRTSATTPWKPSTTPTQSSA